LHLCRFEGGAASRRQPAPQVLRLSSGQAGTILQRLRTYRVRLAVVAPKERVVPSPLFVDMVAEERRSGQFALFETRDAAAAWLVTGEHEAIPG